jgi:hypothetical protein
VGAVGHRIRPFCGLCGQRVPDGKRECPPCKKNRDDRHRLNARLAGKDAARQREWHARRQAEDPEFRARHNERRKADRARPERLLAERLGVSVEVARVMLEAGR